MKSGYLKNKVLDGNSNRMVSTCGEIFFLINLKSATAIDLKNLLISLYTCAPIFELPSNQRWTTAASHKRTMRKIKNKLSLLCITAITRLEEIKLN